MRRRDFIKVGSVALAGLSAFAPDRVSGAAAAKTNKVLYFTACAGFVHSPVNRKGDRPFGSMTKISLSPSGRESKAIRRPSGDHRGVPEC